jgi:hypothetical protein
MTDAEREQLSAMPEMLKVYRGFSHMGGQNGWSWTLDLEKAKFFATYAGGPHRAMRGATRCEGAFVVSGMCHKSDIIAFINERTEWEIIIPASKVSSKIITSLPSTATKT